MKLILSVIMSALLALFAVILSFFKAALSKERFAVTAAVLVMAAVNLNAQNDTLVGGELKSTLDSFWLKWSQLAYMFCLWAFGIVIKKYGDTIPVLKMLPSTTVRVFSYAIMAAIGFALYNNDSVDEYLKAYAIGTSIYELGLKWLFDTVLGLFNGGNGDDGDLPPLANIGNNGSLPQMVGDIPSPPNRPSPLAD